MLWHFQSLLSTWTFGFIDKYTCAGCLPDTVNKLLLLSSSPNKFVFFFSTGVEANKNSWQSLDAILKQCKYAPILMQTYSVNLEWFCRCPSKGGFTVNKTSTLSTEHWEDKSGRRSFNLPARSASFLPSITLWRFMSLAHANMAKAQGKAASMCWGLGITLRFLSCLCL